jgi:hypothetical protein
MMAEVAAPQTTDNSMRLGISTWFVALLWSFANLRPLVVENHTEFVLLLAMIFAGLMFEDAGSHFGIVAGQPG